MNPPPLPLAFVKRMRAQLGPQADAYFAALNAPCVRGLRLNPRKPIRPAGIEGLLSPVPWAANAFFLSSESPAGGHPLHEAGAYYLQEPSAMIPAHVLAPRPGERVLDLCAAPGGKSTQLADMLMGDGLLVCNEPVFSRAQVLSRNLERMGVPNALAVSMEPERLAALWPDAFDAVLVDAPCSGEGMFRRHPKTRLEWEESAPARCALRQRRILESAVAMLKPGGRLAYSTCTLNREENEEVVRALLSECPALSPIDFSVALESGIRQASRDGMLRVCPHEIRGEGHFIALLRKETGAPSNTAAFAPARERLAEPPKPILEAYAAFCKGAPLPKPCAMLGDTLLSAPLLPSLQGVRVLRAGLHLGRLKGRVFAPDHALAMAHPHPYTLPSVLLNAAQARAYLAGKPLFMESLPRGYVLAVYEGLSLGFGKCGDGQLKNHYPKGLRRPD